VTKDILESLVSEGLSTTEIGRRINLSQTCTRYWLTKYGLKTSPLHSLENRFKFSNDQLLGVWNESDSVNQFLLKLGVGTSGGAWYHYKKRLQSLGIDFSDSILNGRSRGGQSTAKLNNAKALLKKERLKRSVLKKLMDLNKVPYQCSECFLFEWRGKKLKLHIHHKDHDKKNNVVENLEYLCPNCHGIHHHVED
jgi:hypothetical protein